MNTEILKEKTLIQHSLNIGTSQTANISRLDKLGIDPDGLPIEVFIQKIKEVFEVQNITYFCPSFPGRSLFNPYFVTTYSTDWIEHYKSNNYGAVDPVLTEASQSIFPVDWATLPKKNPKAKKMFSETSKFGVGQQGLTIPIRGPLNGVWALFILTSNDNSSAWEARHYELLRDLFPVAYYVHQRACRLHFQTEEINLNTLSRRENEALGWCAQGKAIEDIGLLMSISPETVKGYLDSARYKLGALNRVHAVVKAIRAGLIG